MDTKLVKDLINADTVRFEWCRGYDGWQDLISANIYLLSGGLLSHRIGAAIGAVMDFETAYGVIDATRYRMVYSIGNTSTTTKPMNATKLIGVLTAWGLYK